MSRSELFYPGGNTIINNSLTFSESAIPVVSEFYTKKRFPFLMIKKTYYCKSCNDFPLLEPKDSKFIHSKCSWIEGKTTLETMSNQRLKLVEN